jgi:hypothetical protein
VVLTHQGNPVNHYNLGVRGRGVHYIGRRFAAALAALPATVVARIILPNEHLQGAEFSFAATNIEECE